MSVGRRLAYQSCSHRPGSVESCKDEHAVAISLVVGRASRGPRCTTNDRFARAAQRFSLSRPLAPRAERLAERDDYFGYRPSTAPSSSAAICGRSGIRRTSLHPVAGTGPIRALDCVPCPASLNSVGLDRQPKPDAPAKDWPAIDATSSFASASGLASPTRRLERDETPVQMPTISLDIISVQIALTTAARFFILRLGPHFYFVDPGGRGGRCAFLATFPASMGIHFNRAAGGHCHHRRAHRPVATGDSSRLVKQPGARSAAAISSSWVWHCRITTRRTGGSRPRKSGGTGTTISAPTWCVVLATPTTAVRASACSFTCCP